MENRRVLRPGCSQRRGGTEPPCAHSFTQLPQTEKLLQLSWGRGGEWQELSPWTFLSLLSCKVEIPSLLWTGETENDNKALPEGCLGGQALHCAFRLYGIPRTPHSTPGGGVITPSVKIWGWTIKFTDFPLCAYTYVSSGEELTSRHHSAGKLNN